MTTDHTDNIAAYIIVGGIMLSLITLSAVLLRGKGARFIAGYNMLGEKGKEPYDSAALCRFMGKYLLSVSLPMPAPVIGRIFGIRWLMPAYISYLLVSAVLVIAYCNTADRFRRQ